VDGAKSQSALATLLGVSQPAVSKLVRHADWPVSRRRGPWSQQDVLAIVRWHEGLQDNRAAALPGAGGGGGDGQDLARMLKQTQIAYKAQQTKTAKLKHEMLEQERVTREMFEGGLAGLASTFVEMVEGWRLAIPSRFPGVDPEGLNLILDSGLKQLADKLEVEAKGVDEVVMKAKASRRGRPRSA